MADSKKLLVLALDAASPELLAQWAEEGVLEHTARLMRTGLVAGTRSVEGLYVGATWPSFYTASDPSQHGIYWLDRIRVGSYRTRKVRPRDFAEREALWETLSRAGKRVLVLDVPLTRLSPGLNGMQVVEWGVHDAAFGFRTRPASLRRQILDTVGPHPAPSSCDARRSPADYRVFADQLMAGAALRARLTRQLLETEAWDFAIQVFSETHCAGHQLWHFHDTSHPAFDPALEQAQGDLLKQVYQAVDAAIGEILAAVEPGTTVVLLALHGMSHVCGGSLLLPEILQRLGVMNAGRSATAERAGAAGSVAAQRTGTQALQDRLRGLYYHLPPGWRDRAYRIRDHINRQWLQRGTPLDLDPATSKAFYVGLGVGSTFSGIRLNLRGREPQGQLSAGEEADRFCRQLTDDLLEMIRPDTGMRLVRRVLQTRDLFEGPHLPGLPDLLVEWEPQPPMDTTATGKGRYSLWQAQSPAIGLVEKRNDYCRTGEHRIHGLMIATGEGISAGRLQRELSILDLAPTFAGILGCEMPGPGGTPVPELLRR